MKRTRRPKKLCIDEINVKRVNIVDEDGSPRLVLSNKKRFPAPILLGQQLNVGQRGPGIIFFNDKGDECGGLVFGSGREPASREAGAGLFFDRHLQDQTVGMMYEEDDGKGYRSGFHVWDRPDQPLIQGTDKGQKRVFIGRNRNGESEVVLSDANGVPRIRLSVGLNDVPSIELLDTKGKTSLRIAPTDGAGTKQPSKGLSKRAPKGRPV